MFVSSEDAARRRVAVLGPQVVSDLGAPSGEAMVGETVRINGAQFSVIGVLASKGQTGGFQNPDDQVLIPVSTLKRYFTGQEAPPAPRCCNSQKCVRTIDIVITTALIPGKPAPKLITEAMVRSMVETAKMTGGYMMCVGNHIPWNVTPEGIKRYLDLSVALAHRRSAHHAGTLVGTAEGKAGGLDWYCGMFQLLSGKESGGIFGRWCGHDRRS